MNRRHDDEAVAGVDGAEEEEPVVADQPAHVVGPGDRVREKVPVEDRPGDLGERVQVLVGNHRLLVVEVLGLGADDAVHARAEPGAREADDGLELAVEDGHDRLGVRAGTPGGRVADSAEPLEDRLVREVVEADRGPEAAVVDQGQGYRLEGAGVLEALVEASRTAREERGRRYRELAGEPGLYRVVARDHAGQARAPPGVGPGLRRLPAHHHEVQTLEVLGVEAVPLDQIIRGQLRVGDVGVEGAHAPDDRVDRHGGVDDARYDEGVAEHARQPLPVVEHLVGRAQGPERDARFVQVLVQAGRPQRQIERVQPVHEDDVVRLAPGDGLAAGAQEEGPLLVVQVQLVDAVAARVDVTRVLVLVVEGEALLVDVVALRLPGLEVAAVEVPRAVQVVVQAVVEAPPGEPEPEVVGRDQRQPRDFVHPGRVVGELGVELRVVEVPVLGQVAGGVLALVRLLPVDDAGVRSVPRPVLLRGIGHDPELRVGPEPEVEVSALVEEVGMGRGSGPGDSRQAEHQPTCRAPHGGPIRGFKAVVKAISMMMDWMSPLRGPMTLAQRERFCPPEARTRSVAPFHGTASARHGGKGGTGALVIRDLLSAGRGIRTPRGLPRSGF